MEEEEVASTVLWRIENIKSWDPYDVETVISSPNIVLNNIGENKWQLNLHKNNRGQLDISLSPSQYVESVSIHCEWTITDGDGSIVFKHESEYETTSHTSRHYMLLSTKEEDACDVFMSHDALTVRLRIWQTNRDVAQSEHVSMITRMLQESMEEIIGWTINGFSAFQLDSEAVTTVYLRGHAFRMTVFLTGEVLADAHVGFSIFAQNAPRQDLTATMSFSGKKKVEMKHVFNSSVLGQKWIVPELITRRRILKLPSYDSTRDSLGLQWTIACEIDTAVRSYIEGSYFGPKRLRPDPVMKKTVTTAPKKGRRTIVTTVSEGRVRTILKSGNSKTTESPESVLFDDISRLYENRILNDFELRSSDGVPFPVHKSILSARSPVFRAMFCGDMAECQSQSLEVPDLDCHTLGAFLAFLYSGNLTELKWEKAIGLYYAADKYNMPSLKHQCSTILRSNITLSNVSEVLELANRHQDGDLSTYVLGFIENNFDAVVFTDEWDRFLERSHLAGKTMKEIYRRRKNIKHY